MDYSNLFVVLMGICTVFIGLTSIIVIVKIMSIICCKQTKKSAADGVADSSEKFTGVTPELVAVIAAAIAEDMNTSTISASITRINKI